MQHIQRALTTQQENKQLDHIHYIIYDSQDMKQPKCLWVTGYKETDIIHTHIYNTHRLILFSLLKGALDICDNMDGLGGLCVKWNEPDTLRKILHEFTYTEI